MNKKYMNKKRFYIISSTFLLIGLFTGVVQYVGILDTLYAAVNNPGHLWSEMECSSVLCIDTANSRVGIGTETPGETLEINGNILTSGNGDVCNGQGKCLSSIFQTNVIVGNNPTCPSGQSMIMKAYNGTWYTPENTAITTWTKVTCGTLLSADGTSLLVNSNHTSKNCTDNLGTVVEDASGNKMCRFNLATCPSTWNQFQNWSKTDGSYCSCYISNSVGYGTTCQSSGTTGSHVWSNNSARESSGLSAWAGCSGGTAGCSCYNTSGYYDYVKSCSCSATATVSQIGCY